MVDFGTHEIGHHYNQASGYGYFQFTKPEFISQDMKILLMKKVSIIILVGLLHMIIIIMIINLD